MLILVVVNGEREMGSKREAVIRSLWQTQAALAMAEMVRQRMAASQPANDNAVAQQAVSK